MDADGNIVECTNLAPDPGADPAPAGQEPTGTTGLEPVIPNAPYTPMVQALTLDYDASIDSEAAGAIEFVHIEPLGYRKQALGPAPEEGGEASVPSLLTQPEHEGALHLVA